MQPAAREPGPRRDDAAEPAARRPVPTEVGVPVERQSHAMTVVMVDLLPGTWVYVESAGSAPPVLVVDTGAAEVQLGVPGGPVTAADVAVVIVLVESVRGCRAWVLERLG